MSRALVKESDADTFDLPDRPLSAHLHFVTAEEFAAIESALNRLDAAHTAVVHKDDKIAIAAQPVIGLVEAICARYSGRRNRAHGRALHAHSARDAYRYLLAIEVTLAGDAASVMAPVGRP